MYYQANKSAEAVEWLNKVIAQEKASPPAGKAALAPEAAHWLCRLQLAAKDPAEAAKIAASVLPQAGESDFLVPLLLDQADAAYETPGRQAAALAMYLKIVADHSQHPSAPQALYNAAFTAMQLKQHAAGLKHAADFAKAYPQHDLLPDVKYVSAECQLQLGKYAAAAETLADLIASYPSHRERQVWQVRHGLCLFLQKNYEETIALLAPLAEKLTSATGRAEAYFLVGASQFHLQRFGDAVKSLRASQGADKNWQRADENSLILSQALHAEKKTAEAIATVKQMLADYPASKLKANAHYRWGDYSFAGEDYETAVAQYDQVIEGGNPESSFIPFALYGKGWAQSKLGQWPAAIATMTTLIDKHPQAELADDGRFARGMFRRQAKDDAGAIADLNIYLESNLEPDEKSSALFERSKAETATGDHTAAAKTLALLLKENAKWDKADEAVYLLAWAYKDGDKTDQSLAAFTRLIEEFAPSKFAAEGHFHLADAAYKKGDYATAEKAYAAAKQKSGRQQNELHEKAIYWHGWSLYQLEQFDAALAEFSEQAKTYAAGPLAAQACS